MYRILVADDEELIRRGIQFLLDYEALGFTICGEAASGEEALAQIQALQPDVVLMDIQMPGLTGLEVIHRAQAQGYQGKILIISGFSDFSYAQEAIRCGVQGYLTKPIDEDELEKLLTEFKTELDGRGHTSLYQRKARSSLLEELLLGTLPQEALDEHHLQLDAACYQVVLWDDLGTGLPSLPERLALQSPLCDMLTPNGQNALLLKGTAAIHQLEALSARSGALDGLFLACGGVFETFQEIPESYRQAAGRMERRFFCPRGVHVLKEDDLRPTAGHLQMEGYTAQLLDCLQSFNRRKLSEVLSRMQEELRGSGADAQSVKLFLTDLYLQIKEHMGRLYPDCAIPFYSNAVIIQTVDQAQFLHEIMVFLAGRFEMIMNAIGYSNRDSVLDDVLHYIQHNFAGDITLESIAPIFGYNRSYLGKIFTQKTGMNFNAYVDQVRVEHAKELLLSSDAKVYTIAQRVGYRNVDYFHIKFKKITGMSPAEFRKEKAGNG